MAEPKEYEISKGLQTLAIALSQQKQTILNSAQEALREQEEAGARLIDIAMREAGAEGKDDYILRSRPDGVIILVEVIKEEQEELNKDKK